MNYFIDIDDTLVRTVGTKVIPIPKAIEFIKGIDLTENNLYFWSRGGGEYTLNVIKDLGLSHLATACLPKPDVLVDDQKVCDWTHLKEFHPNEL